MVSAVAEHEDEKKDWRVNLEAHLAEAKTIAGDIRGKLSEAGKRASEEARETWKKLEPQLGTAEESLRAATDDAVESLKGVFGELKGSLSKLRDKL